MKDGTQLGKGIDLLYFEDTPPAIFLGAIDDVPIGPKEWSPRTVKWLQLLWWERDWSFRVSDQMKDLDILFSDRVVVDSEKKKPVRRYLYEEKSLPHSPEAVRPQRRTAELVRRVREIILSCSKNYRKLNPTAPWLDRI